MSPIPIPNRIYHRWIGQAVCVDGLVHSVAMRVVRSSMGVPVNVILTSACSRTTTAMYAADLKDAGSDVLPSIAHGGFLFVSYRDESSSFTPVTCIHCTFGNTFHFSSF